MTPGSLCLTTAFAPVPAFLGGSCPLGCSLSAPAIGGCSVVSAVLMYAAGSKEEQRAGVRLHGATIAQLFVFCNGGLAGEAGTASARRWGRMVLSWPAPSITGGVGLACAVAPPAPPSDVLRNRGTRCTPGGGCAPCTPLGTASASFFTLALPAPTRRFFHLQVVNPGPPLQAAAS